MRGGRRLGQPCAWWAVGNAPRRKIVAPVRVRIVAHGAGIKFFLEDLSGTAWEKDKINEDLYKRVVGLSKFGVEAYLCQITYKRQNIDPGRTRVAAQQHSPWLR